MIDDRNYDVTAKVYSVLNQIKGFDVAMLNPGAGKILVRYEDIYYELSLNPCYDKSYDAKIKNKSFSEMVNANFHMFKEDK